MKNKITKYTLLPLLPLLALTGIISCGDDNLPEEKPKEEKAILKLDKESIDFGSVFENKSKEFSINISNTGTSDLKITSILVKGADAKAFTTTATATTIVKNESTEYKITYSPKTVGATSASLEIETNLGLTKVALTGVCEENKTIAFTNIPLKDYILQNKFGGYFLDTNGDGEIQYNEAEVLTTLHIDGVRSLLNLKDIEYFVNLDFVFLLDLKNIEELDFSKNTKIEAIRIENCKKFKKFTFSDNSKIKEVQVIHCPLVSFNANRYTNLEFLNLGRTNVKELDLSNNKKLKKFFYNNSYGTDGTAPDNGMLTSLNLANGNNSNMKVVQVSGHKNLTCVKVDASFNPSGWSFPKGGLLAADGTITTCN